MPAPVYIDFVARNMTDVSRAFKTVRDSVVQNEGASTAAVRRGTSERERAYRKLAADAARWQRQQVRDAEKSIASETKATQQSAAAKARIREASATLAGKYAAQAANAEIREAERAARAMARIKERSATMAGRDAARQAAAERRAIDRHYAREGSRREQFANAVVGAGARGVRNAVGATVAGAQRVAGTVLGLGGGFTVADALQDRVTLERKAALFANQAYVGTNTRLATKDVMAKARATSVTTGMDAGELLAASHAYLSKTGDAEGALTNMEFFGKISKATGASADEVANTAGILRVQNADLGPDAMKQMLLNVIMQGKKGAVEFKDLASVAGKITRTSSSFAGKQADNQSKLLGLAQVGIRTSGSAQEAATVISNLSADALKHSKTIAPILGKDFLNETGQIAKAPEEFIADVMEKSGGNMQTIQKMGFGMRSMKMFQALAPTFDKAQQDALAGGASKGDAAKTARAAVMKDMQQFTTAAYSEQNLEGDFAAVMKTSAEQFEGAVRSLKEAVADKLIPVIVNDLLPILQKSVPVVSSFLDGLIKVAKWAAENPIAASIALLGASITKEVMGQIIAAKIGETIKNMITGGGAPPGVPGGAGGGSDLAKGIAAGAAAGAATYAVTKPGIDAVLGGQRGGADKTYQLTAGLLNGGAEREKALAEYAEMQKKYASGDFGGRMKDTYMMAPSAIYSAVTGEKNTTAESMKQRETADQVLANQTLKELVAAMRANTEATAKNTGASGHGSQPGGAARDTNMAKR